MSLTHSDTKGPGFAIWLLESFCSYDYLATALWDLEELYEYHTETKGAWKARWLYLKEAFSIIYHLYFKGQSQYSFNTIAMFKNNIIIALRNFRKHKSYALLNVMGLSSGLIIFLLITRYTEHEFSYDTYHEKADRIYRVYKKINTLEELYLDAGTPGPLATAMVTDFPEVEAAARFSMWRNQLMTANGKSFLEPAVYAVDPDVFNMFSLELIHGNEGQVMSEGPNIAISETVAMKYFGRTDVVNETLVYDGEISLTISGVFETMPANSHFTMDIIVNFEWAQNVFNQDLSKWNNNPFFTYVLLKEGTDAGALETKLPVIREKYASDPLDADGQAYTYLLQPLSEVHFAEDIHWSLGTVADSGRLYVFTGIALIVLLMASINYVNLLRHGRLFA